MGLRIISTQDICLWKGVQLRSAQREMKRMRDYHDKAAHQYITNTEAAEYYGIPVSLFDENTKTTDQLTEKEPTYPLRLIDARDLANLRKTSMAAAYQFLHTIKKALGKRRHQYVTNQEAARYLGLKIDEFEVIVRGSDR